MLLRIVIFILIISDAVLFGKILLSGKNVQLLNPKGVIALQERDLMLAAIAIMLIVVVPVFILAFHVATKYHSQNTKAVYDPDWDHNTKLQIFIWAFPTLIIVVLSVINWVWAHKLDPKNDIASSAKTITVQVIALRWKWLFIYPEQGIATINYLVIPEKTPVNFELTASDTPMNSFWIPQLGGQIYSMPGMATQTHLMADGLGVYRGSDAEINGAGFATMDFKVQSVTPQDFARWTDSVRSSPLAINFQTVRKLSEPTTNNPVAYYASVQNNLFNEVVMQYMAMPTGTPANSTNPADAGQQMPGMAGMTGM